ncbi:MAG: YIP1 family protein [Thermoanaerobaculia bacterium]
MSDERSSDIDFGAAHLRPAQREQPAPGDDPASAAGDRIPWEGGRRRGVAAAYIATWWRLVREPVAVWRSIPAAGGVRRPWAFALLCGAVFGVVSELVDSSTVALIRHGGGNLPLAELFQLDVAGRSFDWLPISLLSTAGCLFALLIGAPLFVLFYSLLVIAWSTLLHVLLKISGGLASSETGYEGTLRAVCYSQVAMAAAIVPWVGDPIAGIWGFTLQVPGLVRMHGCSRLRAALVVGLPAAALIVTLVLLLLMAEPRAVAGGADPAGPG